MAGAGESEWPVVMIYVIFTAILLVMGMASVFNLMKFSDIKLEGDLSDMEYTLLTARMLNSDTCLAYEKQVQIKNETYTQVRMGIIDWSKVNKQRLDACLPGVNYYVELTDLSDGEKKTIQTETAATKVRDVYFVKIFKNNQMHDGIIIINLFD